MAGQSNFTDYLVMEMEDTESTAWVDSLLAAARTKIEAGQGQLAFFTSTSVNGKAYTANQVLTCLDVATACRTALRIYGDSSKTTPHGVTSPDFSAL